MSDARRWVAEVEAAYADGGYAAGDNPAPPLDEMTRLLDRHDHLERVLRKIIEASAVGAVGGPDFTEDGGIVLDAFIFATDAEAQLIRQFWHGRKRWDCDCDPE